MNTGGSFLLPSEYRFIKTWPNCAPVSEVVLCLKAKRRDDGSVPIIDVDVLFKTWMAVIHRHESLRTRYHYHSQIITRKVISHTQAARETFELVDLDCEKEDDIRQEVVRRTRGRAQLLFPELFINGGSPVHKLFFCQHRKFKFQILVLITSHIAIDGFSLFNGPLIRDIEFAYLALCKNKNAQVMFPTKTYNIAKFAEALFRYATSGRMIYSVKFWQILFKTKTPFSLPMEVNEALPPLMIEIARTLPDDVVLPVEIKTEFAPIALHAFLMAFKRVSQLQEGLLSFFSHCRAVAKELYEYFDEDPKNCMNNVAFHAGSYWNWFNVDWSVEQIATQLQEFPSVGNHDFALCSVYHNLESPMGPHISFNIVPQFHPSSELKMFTLDYLDGWDSPLHRRYSGNQARYLVKLFVMLRPLGSRVVLHYDQHLYSGSVCERFLESLTDILVVELKKVAKL